MPRAKERGQIAAVVEKDPKPRPVAVEIMREGRGQHFDPDVLDAFLELQGEFQEIARRYADSDEDMADKADHLSAFEG